MVDIQKRNRLLALVSEIDLEIPDLLSLFLNPLRTVLPVKGSQRPAEPSRP
jgi:hypothetical protein